MGDRNITKQESDDKAVEVTRRTSRITIREPQSYGDRIIIIGVSVLGVAVAYLITDPYLNPVTGILAVVPVTITGLLLGKWAVS